MIRNLIWDVDGTLFDTYPAIVAAFGAALDDLGAEAPPERIRELSLVSLDHCLSALAEDHRLATQPLEDAFRARYAERAIADSRPFPGVIDVCRYICASGGSNVIVTHRRRSSTDALLAANGMVHLFAGLVAVEDGYPRKPDPTMFEVALARHRLGRAETVSIGDRALDIDAAQAAGLLGCWFGSGPPPARADLVVRGYDQLLDYLVDVNAGAAATGEATTGAATSRAATTGGAPTRAGATGAGGER